jgi:hypothetical protein
MIGRMNRRELLLGLIIVPALKSRQPRPLAPPAFPWAVDRTGDIARRAVMPLRSENEIPPVIDLTPLHLALDSYMYDTDNPRRIALVRRHLALVRAATADETLPFPWREMHEFTTILLTASKVASRDGLKGKEPLPSLQA